VGHWVLLRKERFTAIDTFLEEIIVNMRVRVNIQIVPGNPHPDTSDMSNWVEPQEGDR